MKEEIKIWCAVLEDINEKIVHKEYEFMDVLDFINLMLEDVPMSMQIYWTELLQWLHLASVTTLMRNEKWMQGIWFGVERNNYIIFASALRGYFEAFFDSYYSTNFKFLDIAANFSNINKALKGKMDRPLLCNEFEESLIHFYSASKNANSKTHNVECLSPLKSREYINDGNNGFDLPNAELRHQLYSELCEVVHPASPSVKCFTTEEDISTSNIIQTVPDRDSELIEVMLNKYSSLLKLIFRISNTVPVVNLKTLNHFNEPSLSASYIDDSLISRLSVKQEAWQAIEKKLIAEKS